MSVEIPLRAKYLSVTHGKQKSPAGGHAASKKNRHSLTQREKDLHAAQPKKVMILKANGKRSMVVA